MRLLFVFVIFSSLTGILGAAEPLAPMPVPLAERYLHDGRFADGETASLLALDANPADDEARFGLGVIQFARAVENLGKALYEYGAVSQNASQPFLRLRVPRNEKPSTISYKELGRVLDAFAADLGRAEATLAGIKDEKVKLRLRLSKITFDFAGTGKDRSSLLAILANYNGGQRFDFQRHNPDFRVHFDYGDIAWLRAYCHLLSAMVEGYRAVDEAAGFEERVAMVFPNVETQHSQADPAWYLGLKVIDAPRLRRARLHLVAVCELNRETWKSILAETDDDHEWLPHPRQLDQLGMPISKERIDGWLAMMEQLEGFLKGELLLPGNMLNYANRGHAGGGLNMQKLLDNPPADLLNWKRIQEQGVDAKYLEPEDGKKKFVNINVLFESIWMFNGPMGFAYAARLN